LLEKGPEFVSDAGLVAILLRIGIKGKDAVSLGRELINHFGGLRGLLNKLMSARTSFNRNFERV
jgi:DNA repair protein RadC